MEMDEHLKQLVKNLGETINSSLSASTSFNQAISKIRNEGYELVLVLEVTVGLNKKVAEGEPAAKSSALVGTQAVEGEGPKDSKASQPHKERITLTLSQMDRQFLRSMKIKIDEEEN